MVSAFSGVSVTLAPRPLLLINSRPGPSLTSFLAILPTPKVIGAMIQSPTAGTVINSRDMFTLMSSCSRFSRYRHLRSLLRRGSSLPQPLADRSAAPRVRPCPRSPRRRPPALRLQPRPPWPPPPRPPPRPLSPRPPRPAPLRLPRPAPLRLTRPAPLRLPRPPLTRLPPWPPPPRLHPSTVWPLGLGLGRCVPARATRWTSMRARLLPRHHPRFPPLLAQPFGIRTG